jgi:SAM-dependent methyltransferase
VIEHIAEPAPLVAEVARCLKPGGRFVLTTPKRAAEWLIAVYARDIGEEHQRYYGPAEMAALAGGAFEITGYHTFLAGLNQAFCLTRTA